MQQSEQLFVGYPLSVRQIKPYFVADDNEFTMQISGARSLLIFDVLSQISARNSVVKLNERASLSDAEEIGRIVDSLAKEKLIFRKPVGIVTGLDFSNILKKLYAIWNELLFSDSLWTKLAGGQASNNVLEGWLIETYHFIRGANSRLPYAASLCPDERIREIFVHHHTEEYNHYKFFGDSLARKGIIVEHVERLGPLISTRAVINMSRSAARSDYLAYAACSGLLESTGTDSQRARAFYGAVASHYDKNNTGFIDPMLQHVDLDEAYEHGDVMNEIFAPIPTITAEQADRVLRVVFEFVETLRYWFQDIERCYERQPYNAAALYRTYKSNI
jgi:Iron-containing redox enzyme